MVTLHEVITFLVSMLISISSLQTLFPYTTLFRSGNKVTVDVAAKGGGSENKSKIRMMNPSDSIVDWVDRKSTRLNSSHVRISYAVFCLKKKSVIRGFTSK